MNLPFHVLLLRLQQRSQLLSILILLLLCCAFFETVCASVKFNQRIFLAVKAIHYVDPTKQGFRVILRDEFLRAHMAPTLLPTLYLTAIPLRQSDEEHMQTKIFYPDSVNEEKQVSIGDLRECSWYYVCVEWENFNRHNETTGADCRLFRTLDRFGKGADTTVSELEATDFSSQMLQFRMRASADFPIRLTASLEGGKAPAPQAQVFMLSSGPAAAELDVIFPFLRQQMDYGQLCVLEEPLVTGFSALGRLVAGVGVRKCHFTNLTTTDYELSILESVEASPYMRSNGARGTGALGSRSSLLILTMLTAVALCQCGGTNGISSKRRRKGGNGIVGVPEAEELEMRMNLESE